MIELFCLFALIIVLILAFFFIFCEKGVSKKVGKQTLFLITSVFIAFSFFFRPESFIRWDLIEHFKTLEEMHLGGWSYLWKESQYADLFVYNMFAYLISFLPQNLWNLLSTVPLIIDFAIILYIYKEIYNEYFQDANGKVRVLSVLIWLFTFGIKLAITGIRCSLAVSIVTLAIFWEMIQKRHRGLAALLYVIAIFVHNFALVIVFVRLLSKIKQPLILLLGSLSISLALEPIARYIVSHSSIDYINFTFQRILETVETMGFFAALKTFNGSTLAIYMCFVGVTLYLLFIAMRAKKRVERGSIYELIVDLAVATGAVAIGLSFNYLYLERFMYFVSYVLFLMIPIHNKRKMGVELENIIILPISLFLFFFNDIYLFIVNYVGFYFLAQK